MTLTNQQNDDDISEDEREDVESLVEATTYWPGGNRRFTWENLNVPMPSAVKKIIAERKETEEDQEEEKGVQEEINTNAAPTGQEERRRRNKKDIQNVTRYFLVQNEQERSTSRRLRIRYFRHCSVIYCWCYVYERGWTRD